MISLQSPNSFPAILTVLSLAEKTCGHTVTPCKRWLSSVRFKYKQDHVTCYKFKCSHWWKIYFKKNPLQDLLSSVNAVISTNAIIEYITGHMTYNLAYT